MAGGIQPNQLDTTKPTISTSPQTSKPATGAGKSAFYPKNIGNGVIEFFFVDESGNETQITERGNVKGGGSGPGSAAAWRNGTTIPADSLGSNGDYYLRTTTGDVYTKVAGTWGTPICNITGPQGAPGAQGNQGIQGIQGIQGATGATGAKGDTGNQGIQGVAGPKGDTGNTGAAGTNGTNGTNGQGVPVGGTSGQVLSKIDGTDFNTQWVAAGSGGGTTWYNGAGAPSGATGIVGDYYLNSTSGDFSKKTGASTWTVQGNLKGPTGATGSQGIQGIQGIQGVAGTNGTNGQGVPVGGTTGQVLAKSSNTDYATQWVAAGSGGGSVVGYKTFLSNNVTILAAGANQAALDAITATKDFGTSLVSKLIIGNPSGAKIQSIDVTFTAAETVGRSQVDIVMPEPNGQTSMPTSIKPIAFRLSASYGVANTGGITTNDGAGNIATALTGYTAGSEQKAKMIC